MKTNLKLKKAIKLRSEQDNLRIKALNKGVEFNRTGNNFPIQRYDIWQKCKN